MFGLGYQEILVILVIALLVFGPTKLPEIGRQVGGMLREMRKMTGDVQRAFDLDGSGSHDRYDSRYDHDYRSTPQIAQNEVATHTDDEADKIHDTESTDVPALTYKSTTPVEFDELTEEDKPSEEESAPEEIRETKPGAHSVSETETKETDSKEPKS